MAIIFLAQILIVLLCPYMVAGKSSVMLAIRSSCDDTIWPVIVSKPHSSQLISEKTTGFALQPGESKTVSAPADWAGTLWGRTHCSRNATGKFICGTGDCGSFAVECPGGATAPAATTLAVFNPTGSAREYSYFISLAKGFNLAMTVAPRRNKSGSSCGATGCVADLIKECPKEVELVIGNDVVIGCNSACEAFEESRDHYCGRPSNYSNHFKRFCPQAQAFENDKTCSTTFECSSADYYDVNFCASSFPPSPPPSRFSSIANSPVGYDPVKEEFSDNSSTSTPLWIKIIVSVLCSLVVGGVGYAAYALWSCRDQILPCYNPKLCGHCCNHWACCSYWACCNWFNSTSDPGV